MNIDAKLGLDVFKLDKEPHIVIEQEICATVCTNRACLYVCPADLYELDDEKRMTVNWEGLPRVRHLPDLLRAQSPQVDVPALPDGVQYRMS